MILPVLLLLVILVACWTAGYFAAKYVYGRLDWQPGQLAQQLITSVAGFMLLGTLISIVSRFSRKRENDYFQQMIDALKRISRGDFQVYLALPGRGRGGSHPFNELVKSVNEMAANLKNMEEMRQEFISNVSHEIQSPLTSIGGFARVLKQEELTREQSLHYLDIIERESARLSKLSENMLRLASLDSEHHPFRPAAYRLDKQLQLLILACEPQWLDKGIEMTVELDEVMIEADADMLSQVWVNVLHNAIKFTPEGGEVSVTLTAGGDQAIVSIKDTGIGISDEDLAHIFERFYKVDRARSLKDGGNGLGLSIIQKIVDIHKGNISVASALGKGTEFIITLPL
ncbi:sensor histidine kinase [Paenibacillus caui]|uniref:sensor histidine kinase n=1 Tax=Paenibacillus caui TaxID=2873927 RepID=UPI001CA98E0E|nr:ATP-binding protein [Paenibacillus caui]